MEMTVKEVLIAARAKIADPEDWTQGVYARNAYGEIVLPKDSEAVCWCSAGAVESVTYEYDLLRDAMDQLAFTIGRDAVSFNDTHTHAEVIAKFDEAIAAQGGE